MSLLSPEEARSLLGGPVETVARRLLGAVLHVGAVGVRLSEVEAYAGADDAASHAARGRTRRNRFMFGEAGRLYCYASYGLHVCTNVVTGPPGQPAAVLLRAGEVVRGVEVARVRRPGRRDQDLARGPGNLGRALGVTLDLDGVEVLERGASPVSLELTGAPTTAAPRVISGPRVGVSAEADRPWRWHLDRDPTVSRYRRSSGAPPPEFEPADPTC